MNREEASPSLTMRFRALGWPVALGAALTVMGQTPTPPSAPAAGNSVSVTAGTKTNAVTSTNKPVVAASSPSTKPMRMVKTDAEWRKQLTPEQYRVLRQKGTEQAFTGAYWNHHEEGTYKCAGCGAPLFSSGTKFDSGCGWPSFYQPTAGTNVAAQLDLSHGMRRTEVLCSQCGGHLGHVFNDGPRPTGLRYCINSASIEFDPKAAKDAKETKPEPPGKSEK